MSDGKTYPPSLFPENDRRIKGFIWRETEQPKTKEDIFKKKSTKSKKQIVLLNSEKNSFNRN